MGGMYERVIKEFLKDEHGKHERMSKDFLEKEEPDEALLW